jgi:hypothetical protein
MCMISVNGPGTLDLFSLRRAVLALAPRAALAVERRPIWADETALMITFDGARFAVHGARGRIPEAVYTEAVSANLLWPDAAEAMARHSGCVTLCAVDRPSARSGWIAQAAGLTRLAAAVARTVPTAGVHWVGSDAMTAPEGLQSAVARADAGALPMDLWLGHRTFGTDRPGEPMVMGCRTLGAAPYLGAELGVAPFRVVEKVEPARLLFAAAAALAGDDVPVVDGATLRLEASGTTRAYRLQRDREADTPTFRLVAQGDADGAGY